MITFKGASQIGQVDSYKALHRFDNYFPSKALIAFSPYYIEMLSLPIARSLFTTGCVEAI